MSDPETAAAPDEPTMVVFRLADREFAADVLQVREIVRVAPVTRMPRAPRAVLGMMNLRGRVVPLLDLRRYLDLPPAAETALSRVVIVAREGGAMLGLLVDAVVEVRTLPAESVEPASATLDAMGELLTGMAHVAERILFVLDLKRIARALETEEPA